MRRGPVPARRAHVVRPDTELVVEGFPRSANGFATGAITVAQAGRRPALAHHMHVPSQVLTGVARRLPVLVVIRRPADAVASFAVMEPDVTTRAALSSWLDFYRRVAPLADRFVLATFEDVTADMGRVIDRINERFGTSFVRFEHTDGNVARVTAGLERANKRRHRGAVDERSVARPSGNREALKSERTQRFDDPGVATLLREAEELYRALTQA
jgi:hypothetical protein